MISHGNNVQIILVLAALFSACAGARICEASAMPGNANLAVQMRQSVSLCQRGVEAVSEIATGRDSEGR